RHVAIIGMVPHSLQNRLGLSEPAAAALDGMVEMLVGELSRLGVEVRPRGEVRAGHWRRQADLEGAA
ncbi:MAG TPA: hypothetical protein PK375_08565, partial [Rhodocyclaceae bacterium]|nr:hypothetical protein [Rhodocyclaceae bacterium]